MVVAEGVATGHREGQPGQRDGFPQLGTFVQLRFEKSDFGLAFGTRALTVTLVAALLRDEFDVVFLGNPLPNLLQYFASLFSVHALIFKRLELLRSRWFKFKYPQSLASAWNWGYMLYSSLYQLAYMT